MLSKDLILAYVKHDFWHKYITVKNEKLCLPCLS